MLGLQLACPKLMAKGQAYPVASSIELKGHSTKNNARWPDAVAAAARLFEARARAHDGEVRQRVLVELSC